MCEIVYIQSKNIFNTVRKNTWKQAELSNFANNSKTLSRPVY